MIGFDPLYFMLTLPAFLLAGWAQLKVKSAYEHAKSIPSESGLSGAQAAQAILDRAGVTGVGIETVPGSLSDHYDPTAKVLRLSPDVGQGRSIASLGIAAHEVGHAIQDAKGYPLLAARNAIVPLANFGSQGAFMILFLGMAMRSMGLITAGLILFSAVVLFQLVNLPVEFDASSRAKKLLLSHGIISEREHAEVERVLSAAAMTYVAATLSAVLTFVYYLVRSGLLSSRNREE